MLEKSNSQGELQPFNVAEDLFQVPRQHSSGTMLSPAVLCCGTCVMLPLGHVPQHNLAINPLRIFIFSVYEWKLLHTGWLLMNTWKYELTYFAWGLPMAKDRCNKFDILGTFWYLAFKIANKYFSSKFKYAEKMSDFEK